MKESRVRVTCRNQCFAPNVTDQTLPHSLILVTILTGNCGACNAPLSVERLT
jgi:hypothetical protein